MAAPDALLSTLNPDQRAAVTDPDGPLQVIAGAGTGKTRVLVARIAWLITTGRARPEQICALAFMNDAAAQIARRLQAAIGPDAARRVWAGTSHRLASRLLRGHAARFGRGPGFSIWDEHDVDAALRDTLAATHRTVSRGCVRAHARRAAERMRPPHAGTGTGEGHDALPAPSPPTSAPSACPRRSTSTTCCATRSSRSSPTPSCAPAARSASLTSSSTSSKTSTRPNTGSPRCSPPATGG
jgi:hypothetical protein